jgi:hypothetical protein
VRVHKDEGWGFWMADETGYSVDPGEVQRARLP